MDSLRTSILATVIYYDAFNFPLTLAEVYKYLINPRRFFPHLLSEGRFAATAESNHSKGAGFSNNEHGVLKLKVADIINELDSMARAGIVGHKNGFYFVNGREKLYAERIEKDKLANRKWKKFLRAAKYLQAAPYLRAVFASGSLAVNNPEPKSDFDIFIIIKSGRLYTGRLFLWLISSMLGARRGRFDIIAPDKFCFNHYLADDNLELSHRSLYIAQTLTAMKPIIFYDGVLNSFTSFNKWVNSYCYNFRQIGEYRSIKPNKAMLALAWLGEAVLDTSVGDLFERMLKVVQQKRIKNNPATYESGGRVIFTDKELEFHPRSFERVVINNYNSGLKKMGVLGVLEKDSGLTPYEVRMIK